MDKSIDNPPHSLPASSASPVENGPSHAAQGVVGAIAINSVSDISGTNAPGQTGQ
eukprot:CAMPEP_0117075060 /NCGR_PEP_ID=MMETSP0472-20121206/52912_1 /TAXON_ID=693140 ORGANISM="Tiarina fusus, Strain LIS" /NCGR_SAMPLE_ID=MMETSP0472 /ASSEMBLY_ACC=CAM_ASM_000603 /LENGTH=54 /DNA_ID=CAMNT_0004800395 /DNA_START=47 /DNA_END=208 /DNA_ORIENTATION=+